MLQQGKIPSTQWPIGLMVWVAISTLSAPVTAFDADQQTERHTARTTHQICQSMVHGMMAELQPNPEHLINEDGSPVESEDAQENLTNIIRNTSLSDDAIKQGTANIEPPALREAASNAMMRHRNADDRLSINDFDTFMHECREIQAQQIQQSMESQPGEQTGESASDQPTTRDEYRRQIIEQNQQGQVEQQQTGQQQREQRRQQRRNQNQSDRESSSDGGFQLSPSTGGRR